MRKLLIPVVVSLAVLTACGSDDAETTETQENSKPSSSSGGAMLPPENDCDAISPVVDLRPLLGMVNDESVGGSCTWAGPELKDDNGSPTAERISFEFIEGLPATYAEADKTLAITETQKANTFLVTPLEPANWAYGVMLTGSVDAIAQDSTATIAYYYVESDGRGAVCKYKPVIVGEMNYGDPDEPQQAYLEEREPMVQAMCDQVLDAAMAIK